MVLYPVIIAAVIAADQITKYMVRSAMQPGDSIPLIGGWLRLLYVRNTGTAFSMFSGNKWVTVVLTTILIIVCLIFMIREAREAARHAGSTDAGSVRAARDAKVTAVMLAFIFAGGLSNLIDRIVLGYVTDMISCGSFAVFNVADIGVTCGCILLVLYILFSMRDDDGEEDGAAKNGREK